MSLVSSIHRASDPRIFGPGLWFAIHTLSFDLNEKSDELKFSAMLSKLINNLKCPKCKKHAIAYLKRKPITKRQNAKHLGEDVSVFRWTWIFHNYVNSILGKPLVSFIDAFDMFRNNTNVCSKGCGSGKSNFRGITPIYSHQ